MARRRRPLRLEMTSLMDVMFLVLVFFIYCIFDMSVHRGVKVELPQAAGEMARGEKLVVTILPDDALELNGVAVSREELLGKIARLKKEGVVLPVILAGDRKASLGAGISLLAALKKQGVEKVSFQVSGDGSE
jgi:biopolymer transport protein ExbD